MHLLSRLLAFVLLVSALEARAAAARAAPTRPPGQTAVAGGYKGAIVVDAATGRVLFEDNADLVSPPASMTKLMTAAVVFDRIAAGAFTLQSPVKIDKSDADMGGTQVYLDARETFPVEELLYAAMIQSANDAAYALGRFAGGSVEGFVALMNAKAKELGMTHTTFRSPHGLPPDSRHAIEGDLTTPRDFAVLSRYLLQRTNILKYTSVRLRDFANPPLPPRKAPTQMKNHNNLLGKVAGVDGLKTGLTDAAGYCISLTAQRNGQRVIVVTMGGVNAPNRDLKATELLERGFALLGPGAAPSAPAPRSTGIPTISVPGPTAPASDAPPRLSLPGGR